MSFPIPGIICIFFLFSLGLLCSGVIKLKENLFHETTFGFIDFANYL